LIGNCLSPSRNLTELHRSFTNVVGNELINPPDKNTNTTVLSGFRSNRLDFKISLGQTAIEMRKERKMSSIPV
ncbi:MAG: hypothetical protein JW801_12840, partial [Bacteroidales bacterium]|nr:hypothetical protein [Bacteroidales bacterium]